MTEHPFCRILKNKTTDIIVGNSSLKAYLVLKTYLCFPSSILLISPTMEEAVLIKKLLSSFSECMEENLSKPVINLLSSNYDDPLSFLSMQYKFFYTLLEQENTINIIDYSALFRLIPDPYHFMDFTRELKKGDKIDRDEFLNELHEFGYKRCDLVRDEGEYANRGFIVDVFIPYNTMPFRLELDEDDIILSIRTFDCISQRSVREEDKLLILPIKHLYSFFDKETVEERGGKLSVSSYVQSQKLNNILENYKEMEEGPCEFLSYLLYDSCIMDFITDETAVIIDEKKDFQDFINDFNPDLSFDNDSIKNKALDIKNRIRKSLEARYLMSMSLISDSEKDLEIESNYLEKYNGDITGLIKDIEKWRFKDYNIMIFLSSQKHMENLSGQLKSQGMEIKSKWDEKKGIHILCGDIDRGFAVPYFKTVFITEMEIYGHRFEKTKGLQKRPGQDIDDLLKLKIKDYVIHDLYGVGKYLGIKTVQIDDNLIDFIEILYKDDDKLFIPVFNLSSIHRYASSEKDISLDKLKSNKFLEKKARIREKLLAYASELMDLYAKRSLKTGFSFRRFADYEDEFDSDFLYIETNDQYRAIHEIKMDMEKESPMDRVLIGDVGFGKTEVIMRAAYLAVLNNKQIAVLVPTTILAQQHYITFLDRFKAYGVNIEMLSRWTEKKDKNEFLEKIKEGKIDIIIGTHRLLSSDIEYKDLGLLIIDEEHKFGVSHKETLRFLKEDIDTITLTATPIPRTYYMSVSGLRDISFIATPPKDRMAIKTQIIERKDHLIRKAVLEELKRGGQIFFVHNRVQSIYNTFEWLREIIPEARIIIGHAQMKDARLERVMLDFLEKKYDILLCTTIIESGLDIPNVNTILIDNADKFGLAQLYQLRGRVGRANIQAYAYLIIKNKRSMTNDGKLRMQAIMNLSELGAGFQLAGYDLDIRGAGNLVGKEQSGHIEQLGIEYYTKLLSETVEELKGNTAVSFSEVEIKLDKSAYIAPAYISDVSERFHFYKKLSSCSNYDSLGYIIEEMEDRFGPIPRELQNVVLINKLRINSRGKGVKSIVGHGNTIVFEFFDNNGIKLDQLLKITKDYKNKYNLKEKHIIIKIKNNSLENIIKECEYLYERIF